MRSARDDGLGSSDAIELEASTPRDRSPAQHLAHPPTVSPHSNPGAGSLLRKVVGAGSSPAPPASILRPPSQGHHVNTPGSLFGGGTPITTPTAPSLVLPLAAGDEDDENDDDGAAPVAPPVGRARSSSIAEAAGRMRMMQQGREARALREAFERFDADKSNSIDVDELGNLMTHLGYSMSRDDLKSLVSQIATDGRTELTYAETEQLTQMYRSAAQFKLVTVDAAELLARAGEDYDSDVFEGDTTPRQQDTPRLPRRRNCASRLFSKVLPMRPSDDPIVGGWESLVLAVASYLWISALVVAVFADGPALEWMDINLAFHVMSFVVLAVDVVVRMRIIGETTPFRIAMIAVDALVALPLDILGYGIAKAHPADLSAMNVMRALVFLKLFKAIPAHYYYAPSGIAIVNRRYIMLYAYMFPAVQVICNMLRMTHLLSVIWYAAAPNKGEDGAFVEAIYFTSYTITGVGYGTVDPVNDTQRLIASAYSLIAQAVVAYVVGSIVAVIAESDVRGDGEHQVVQTLRVVNIAGVGTRLRDDSVNFQDHLVRNKLADAYGDLTANLPKQLRDNITLFVKVRLVANDSVFSLAHRATQVALAQVLESAIFRPGEALYIAGDTLHDMLFVAHGTVQVINLAGETSTIHRSGAHLGEGALLFGSEETQETARCLTHCEIFILRRRAFRDIRSKFPVFDIEMNRISLFIQEKFDEQAEIEAAALHEAHEADRAREQAKVDAAMGTAAVPMSTEASPATGRDDAGAAETEANGDADSRPRRESGDAATNDSGSDTGSRHVVVVTSAKRDAAADDSDDSDGPGLADSQGTATTASPASPFRPSIQRKQQPPPSVAPTPPHGTPSVKMLSSPAPSRSVDFTFRTAAGRVVDLNKVSATFRLAAAKKPTVVAASFRVASMRASASPDSETANMNREERLAALANDSIFGRLEAPAAATAADGGAETADSLTASGDDDDDSNSGGDGTVSSPTDDKEAAEDAMLTECEDELMRIEALLTRLGTRPSGSLLSANLNTTSSPHLSPRGSGRSVRGGSQPPLVELAALADPSDIFEREEGEASGAPASALLSMAANGGGGGVAAGPPVPTQ